MAELLIVRFRLNLHRACGVLDELRVLDDAWIRELREAVAIHRTPSGDLSMDQSYQPTGHAAVAAGWRGVLGVLIGATLGVPSAGGASSSVAMGAITGVTLTAAAHGAKRNSLDPLFLISKVGIPEEFVLSIRKLIGPGDSAIFAILDALNPTQALARFQGLGGEVARTSLSEYQRAVLEAILESPR